MPVEQASDPGAAVHSPLIGSARVVEKRFGNPDLGAPAILVRLTLDVSAPNPARGKKTR
jgi:hypothetical protein